MSWFLNPLVWLWRVRHRCGYGVHSPFAFDFITQVIYEKGQYYAYKELSLLHPWWVEALGLRTRRLSRLLFRLANWQHPQKAVFIGGNAIEYAYMRTAVPSASWGDCCTSAADVDFLYTERPMDGILSSMSKGSMIVVGRLRHQQSFWQELKKAERVTLTFDLYDVGIALVELPLFKQNYVINF